MNPNPKPPNPRPARPDETKALSELALRSKGSWGYDEVFLEACREELTLTPETLEQHPTFVVEDSAELAGFYTLEPHEEQGVVELGMLYVEPRCHGQGIGRKLMEHALGEATRRGFRTLEVQADPYAAPFYLRMGCTPCGSRPSGSIAGRRLPLLRIDL
ncbi:MAG: GNAT family N-acetyltransferase [Acidobacteria bacterium]|nr:GNAT family N-acetyltransferase [Acidobacteriota bacterium]